jgi:hypothetical protein
VDEDSGRASANAQPQPDLQVRLREKLESALLPVRGLVFDLAVRRFRRKGALALVGLLAVDHWLPNPVATILSLEDPIRRQEEARPQVPDHEGLVLYPEPSA